jgi:hypothetical protein
MIDDARDPNGNDPAVIHDAPDPNGDDPDAEPVKGGLPVITVEPPTPAAHPPVVARRRRAHAVAVQALPMTIVGSPATEGQALVNP